MFKSRRLRVPISTLTEQLTQINPWNSFRPAPLALSRRPTRLQRFVRFTTASLSLFVWLLIISALLTALYDMGQQFVHSSRQSKASDLVITFGTYLLVVLIGLTLMISRTIASKKLLGSIPKNYIPTQAEDVPKSAHDLISAEFDRVALISRLALPEVRAQSGWGTPGSAYAELHFRTEILRTIGTLRSVVQPLLPDGQAHLSATSRASALSPLAPLFDLTPSPIPSALEPANDLYETQLSKAQYGKKEPTQAEYEIVLKLVALFVSVLGPKAHLALEAKQAES